MLPSLAFWLAFCVLIALILLHTRPAPAQALRGAAIFALMGWAMALIHFDMFGDHWRRTSDLYAAPLSARHSIPQATQETYERIVLSGEPASYLDDKTNALPAHIAYAAPTDMKAFLAKRQAEGKPLTKLQLYSILTQCGRDVRPTILNALQTLASPGTGKAVRAG